MERNREKTRRTYIEHVCKSQNTTCISDMWPDMHVQSLIILRLSVLWALLMTASYIYIYIYIIIIYIYNYASYIIAALT